MTFSPKRTLIYFIYIIFTSIIFINVNYSIIKNKNINFFFQDTDIKYKIEAMLGMDPNTGTVLISRGFHNKVIFSLESFFSSIFQSLDPVFLFSLSKNAPLYVGPTDIKMLYPIEFPLFIIAVIYIIRSWKYKRDKYFYLLIVFFLSLILIGILLPALHPIKLLPLVITIRTVIFLGIVDWFIKQPWAKKYFS